LYFFTFYINKNFLLFLSQKIFEIQKQNSIQIQNLYGYKTSSYDTTGKAEAVDSDDEAHVARAIDDGFYELRPLDIPED
jgi:hypothetical protein